MCNHRVYVQHVLRALDQHNYNNAQCHMLILAKYIGTDIGQHLTAEHIAAWNVQINLINLHPNFVVPKIPRTDPAYQQLSFLLLGITLIIKGLTEGAPST